MIWCGYFYILGGRYIPKPNGLEILNITKNDNGEYLCKAEITSRGRYEEHPITVEVKGKSVAEVSIRLKTKNSRKLDNE